MIERSRDPLIGAIIELPGGERAKVLAIEHEYDDGTTLRYVTGDYAGSLTMRDTPAVRRYPVVMSDAARDVRQLPGPDCFAHLNPEKYAECFERTSCPRKRACNE